MQFVRDRIPGRSPNTARVLPHQRDRVGGAVTAMMSTRAAGLSLLSLALFPPLLLLHMAKASHAGPHAIASTVPTSSPTSSPTAAPARVVGNIILPGTGADLLRHDYDDVAEVSGNVQAENSDVTSLVGWFPRLVLVTGNVQVSALCHRFWVQFPASATSAGCHDG